MSNIIEKRKICQQIKNLKKQLIGFDKLSNMEIEQTYDYQSYLCGSSELLLCVYDATLKNIRCANDKMVIYQKTLNELISILTSLKCALETIITNKSQDNINVQNAIIDKLFGRYNCLVNTTTFCGCYLFYNNPENNQNICCCTLVPEIDNLVCQVNFLFQSLGANVAGTSLIPSVTFESTTLTVNPSARVVINPTNTSVIDSDGKISMINVVPPVGNVSGTGSGFGYTPNVTLVPYQTTLQPGEESATFIICDGVNSTILSSGISATVGIGGTIISINVTSPIPPSGVSISSSFINPILYILPSTTVPPTNLAMFCKNTCPGGAGAIVGLNINTPGIGYMYSQTNTQLNTVTVCIKDQTGSGAVLTVQSQPPSANTSQYTQALQQVIAPPDRTILPTGIITTTSTTQSPSTITIVSPGCGYSTCPQIAFLSQNQIITLGQLFPILNTTTNGQCQIMPLISDIDKYINFLFNLCQITDQTLKDISTAQTMVQTRYDLKIQNIQNYKNQYLETLNNQIDNLCSTIDLLSINCGKCNSDK